MKTIIYEIVMTSIATVSIAVLLGEVSIRKLILILASVAAFRIIDFIGSRKLYN